MLLPHRLEIRTSPSLALMLALLHLAAFGSLLPLDIPVWLKLALAAAIAASLGVSIRRHALLKAASSIRELVLKADGAVEGLRKDGGRFDARVSGQTTSLSWLIVMLLELPGSRRLHALVILPDALPAEDGRILRAWLRWKLS
jgi:hypothetical protein